MMLAESHRIRGGTRNELGPRLVCPLKSWSVEPGRELINHILLLFM